MNDVNWKLVAIGLFLGIATSSPAEDLALQDAFKEALQKNPTILAARDTIVEGQAALTVADAGFYPNLAASLGVSTGEALTGTTSSSIPGYGASLSSSWSLFNGFSTFASRSEAVANLSQDQANYKVSSSSVLLSVWQAWGQLRFDEMNADLLDQIRQRYHDDTSYEELEFKSGQTARWTWLKSQSDEANVKWSEDQNNLNLKADQANLAALLGRDTKDGAELTTAGDLSTTVAPPDDDSDALASVDSMPVVLVATQAVASSQAAVDVNIATRYPSLNANAALGSSYDGDSPASAEWYEYWTAGVTLSYNLFEGGANEASISSANAALAASQANLSNVRHTTQVALARAWASYLSDYQRLPLASQATAAGDERYKTVGKLYEAGLAEYLDYEQAEEIFTQAQQSELSANLSAVQSQAAYENALGHTLEDEIGEEKP